MIQSLSFPGQDLNSTGLEERSRYCVRRNKAQAHRGQVVILTTRLSSDCMTLA